MAICFRHLHVAHWLSSNCLNLVGIIVYYHANLIAFQATHSIGGVWEPLHPAMPLFFLAVWTPLFEQGTKGSWCKS